jgi:tRNA pseudouridine55 synthase
MNGVLVMDKPSGMTSRDVVNRAQRWFPRRTKIGHAGTLDPLATGVLVLCVGSATKLVESIQNMGKTYWTSIRLGATSDTDDADGVVVPTATCEPPTHATIEAILPGFVGEIQQLPPRVSALKVDGKRAYDIVRRGGEVVLNPRTVRVDAIRFLGYTWPHVELEIDCGKGTYIRSIARDLGERLGVGGLVEQLRRTRIGAYRADDAMSIDVTPMFAHSRLIPVTR